MRYVGPYGAHGIPELWTRFDKWMEARGLRPEARVTLGVGYDDPRITEALTSLSSLHHALPNSPVGLTSSTTAAIR